MNNQKGYTFHTMKSTPPRPKLTLLLGLISAFAVIPAASGGIAITGSGEYTQNFDTLPGTGGANAVHAWTNDSTLPGWFAEGQVAGGALTEIRVGPTSSNGSSIYFYSLGNPIGSSDRALGCAQTNTSNTNNFAFGLLFHNESGTTVSFDTFSFWGEQHRYSGAAASVNTAWYKIGTDPITSPSVASSDGWTALPSLDFSSPAFNGNNPDALGPSTVTDGNTENYHTFVSADISDISLQPDEYIMFRFFDPDHSGSDHCLGYDDVRVSWTVGSFGYPVVDSRFVNTGGFLGWLYLTGSPWCYSYSLRSWIWIASDLSTSLAELSGVWNYVHGTEPGQSDPVAGDTVWGYPVADQHVGTGDFLGWLQVANAPWAYAWNLNTWIWLGSGVSVDLRSDPRSWVYVRNAERNYSDVVLADNPLAYWRFQENMGDFASDSVGDLDLALINSPNLSVLGQGSAALFSALDASYAEAPDDDILDLTGSLTIEFWIYPAFDDTSFAGLVGKGDNAYQIRRNGVTSGLRFDVRGGTGGSVNVDSAYELPSLQWTHVAAVYDADLGQMRLYFNGDQDANVATRSGTVAVNSNGLQIGSNFNGLSYRRFFNGILDEVAIYDYALSADRVLVHYQSARIDNSGIPLAVDLVTASAITEDSAQITWSTNLPASAKVYYGTSESSLSEVSQTVDQGETDHQIGLENLLPETTYYFQAQSSTDGGKTAVSEVFSFDTLEHVSPVELMNVESTQVTSGSALIRWETNNPADAVVRYGLSAGSLTFTSEVIDEGNNQHTIVLDDLESGTTYYFEVTSVDELDSSDTSLVMNFTTLGVSEVFMTSELTQYGITWEFSQEHQAGRFANGDWWVVGPVNVVSVTPAPGVAPADEINNFGANQYGDFGLQDNKTRRNGSMLVLTPANAQGYDSRGLNYNAGSSVSFPYSLAANRSLISSRSYKAVPNLRMHQAIMWSSEKTGVNSLRTAAVLTCLAEAPEAEAFRPPYAGTSKPLYYVGDLRWDRLLELDVPSGDMPNWAQYERYFERPWLDHFNGSWHGQHFLPNENQASYGRDMVRMVGQASLMLHLNVPQATKRKLLIGLVQYGIDLHGMVDLGAHWNEGGGHTSARKWPVLFAGLMLDDESFFDMPSTAIFHEDTQTYYGEGWAGQTALWQMIIHHGVRATYMEQLPSTWDTYDSGWAKTSEGYRVCCTVRAWVGQTLAALLMGAKELWNHNAYFDNVEDWMREEDIYAANRGTSRPATEGSAFESFVNTMWILYRDDVPTQPDGADDLMWVPTGGGLSGSWVSNPKPE